MNLGNSKIVVTSGSRGLGLGLVEALVARGARVSVVARDTDALTAARERLGVAVVSADVTDEAAALVCSKRRKKYADGVVFGLKGDTGITMIEGAAA